MKRNFVLGLALLMILVLAVGCSGDSAKFEDGTYTAESDFDEHGFRAEIEIVVEGGKLTKVDFNEYAEDGSSKADDEEYSTTWESVNGVTPAGVFEELEKSLLDKQDFEKVDEISGATGTTELFKELAKEALK